jgi:tetratricopeptide (TPR) repeat protein
MRLRLFRPQRNQGDTEAAHPVALLRPRRKWPCRRRAAEKPCC